MPAPHRTAPHNVSRRSALRSRRSPGAIVFSVATLLLTLVALPQHLFSDSHSSGFYIDAGAGIALIQPQEDGLPLSGNTRAVWEYSLGFSAHAAVGYDESNFGVEADFNYLSAAVKAYAPESSKSIIENTPETLRMNIIGLMGNVRYTFHTGTIFSPFVGAGAGGAYLSVPDTTSTADKPPTYSGWGFAYQGIAGFGIDVGQGVELKLGYRFFGTPESRLEWKRTGAATLTASPTIISHRIELSVAYIGT